MLQVTASRLANLLISPENSRPRSALRTTTTTLLKALLRVARPTIAERAQTGLENHNRRQARHVTDIDKIRDRCVAPDERPRVTSSNPTTDAWLQSSLDSLPGRIAILDAEGAIVAVNKAWWAFQQQGTGSVSGAVVGANYRHHCESRQVQEALAAALNGRTASSASYELDLPTGRHWYRVTIATFERSEVLHVVVSHEDLTELVNSRQSVADLQSRLIRLQEDERRRIAMELHDSTAQYIVAAGLNLSRLTDTLVEKKARAISDEIGDLLDEALKELRIFTYLLHPIKLSNEGLLVSLRRFTAGLEKRSSLAIELSLDPGIDCLPNEFQRTVLRIAQEALANAHRHAAATRVEFSIEIDDEELHLRVSDNGRGMPQSSWTDPEISSGVGIASMTARVAQFGGKIDFPSGPSGTTVSARIPIPENAEPVPALSPRSNPIDPADVVRRMSLRTDAAERSPEVGNI
jgi:signal transduction histidine kinase